MDQQDERVDQTPQDYFSKEDLEWLQAVADDDGQTGRLSFGGDERCAELCRRFATDILEGDDCYLYEEMRRHSEQIIRYADVPAYGRTLVLCLRYCADVLEDADAMRCLGFLHQIGRFVEQDAHEAERLYRMAEAEGDRQSMVNLGYLYGYGYLGEPDQEASFKQFVKVMALGDYPEAIYKVGDAYARAQVVEKDLRTAYQLYRRCYETCDDLIEIKAQAAFRLAELIVDEGNAEWGIPYDPVMALHLYQVAEVGLRISVADDGPWYKDRLEQAMAGQERARKLMDGMGADLAARHRMKLL